MHNLSMLTQFIQSMLSSFSIAIYFFVKAALVGINQLNLHLGLPIYYVKWRIVGPSYLFCELIVADPSVIQSIPSVIFYNTLYSYYICYWRSNICSLSTSVKFSLIRYSWATNTARVRKPMHKVKVKPKAVTNHVRTPKNVASPVLHRSVSIQHCSKDAEHRQNEQMHVIIVQKRNRRNGFILCNPTQLPIQMQWWSIRATHCRHYEQ